VTAHTLDGLPAFVADSLTAARAAGRRFFVVNFEEVVVGLYAAFDPGGMEAVLRFKSRDGLAEWQRREWRMFKQPPVIVEFPGFDNLIPTTAAGHLWIALWTDHPPTLEASPRFDATCYLLVRNDWRSSVTQPRPGPPARLRSAVPSDLAAWVAWVGGESHDVTEHIPAVWRELLRFVPTAPRGVLGGRTSLGFHRSDASVEVHRGLCPQSDCVDVSSVSPLELLGGRATIQLHPDDWHTFARALATLEGAVVFA
jgi:hypothetical protein